MKLSQIIILTFLLTTLVLTFSGAYVITDNLIHPQGNLFEGIVIFSLGAISAMLIVISVNIGKSIQTFTNVYAQQIEMQRKITEYFQKSMNKSRSIGDILGDVKSSITITDLDTGETTTNSFGDESVEKINEILKRAFDKSIKNNKDPEDLTREELEEKLSNAVKNDDFEEASKCKELIRKLDENNEDKEENL